MRIMTATEVSRNFAAVLDRAEHGETVVITRGGRRLATLAPATAGNGGALRDFLAGHPADQEFAADVAEAVAASVTDEPDSPWPDD